MSISWIDSHCHLQEHYLPEEGPQALEALRDASEAGVSGLLLVGTDEVTSRQAIRLAADVENGLLGEGLPRVRCSIGLHPHEAEGTSLAWLESMLADRPTGVVGVGEAGLDYHYEHSDRASQRTAFAAQIRLAQANELTLVIHARDAWDDLFDVLNSEGMPKQTILHCFTGGPAEAERCVELGMAVSFSGIISFKNAQDLREAAAVVPLEHLLVETDSPWLAPVPHRGKQNQPAWVPLVGEAVAAARGVEPEVVARATRANAARLLDLA